MHAFCYYFSSGYVNTYYDKLSIQRSGARIEASGCSDILATKISTRPVAARILVMGLQHSKIVIVVRTPTLLHDFMRA